MTENKISDIVIYGRRWFQKTYGNTYFSAVGIIDGEVKVKIEFEYGYGDHYVDQITALLEKEGYLPGFIHHNNGSTERMWNYCQRNGIKFIYSATDVGRKKDL
jgi:hypothetical protein